jgi:monofunctional biosynthetic peptidoglycan transglycosylase
MTKRSRKNRGPKTWSRKTRGLKTLGRKSWAKRARRIVLGVLLAILLTPVALLLIYRQLDPPITPLMLIRLIEGEGLTKTWVPLTDISPHVPRAVIALEDNNFCEHHGFDWGEIFDALSEYYKGERLRGASTISMQTTKNLFLWPQRNLLRKAAEAPLTLIMEALWDKRRIIEVYLNIVEWGPGIYGVEAAAQAHFRKPARRLTPREAALLAAPAARPHARLRQALSRARPPTEKLRPRVAAAARSSDCAGNRPLFGSVQRGHGQIGRRGDESQVARRRQARGQDQLRYEPRIGGDHVHEETEGNAEGQHKDRHRPAPSLACPCAPGAFEPWAFEPWVFPLATIIPRAMFQNCKIILGKGQYISLTSYIYTLIFIINLNDFTLCPTAERVANLRRADARRPRWCGVAADAGRRSR